MKQRSCLDILLESILKKNIKDTASPFFFPSASSKLFGICKLDENLQIVFIKSAP